MNSRQLAMVALAVARRARLAGRRRRAGPADADARSFPNRAIRIIVPFPAGGPTRHRRARHRPEDERGLGPAGGDREPARRQHHDRRAGGRQGGARRLHAVHGDQLDAGDEPVPLQEPALRSAQRLRADHADRQDHVGAGGAGRRRSEEREGADRAAPRRSPASSTTAPAPSPRSSWATGSTRRPGSTSSTCRSRARPRPSTGC